MESPFSGSPFAEYLNTNHIPTDIEIERIRIHLIPYEAQVARLDALISDLVAERNRVADYIYPHRGLLSHARRLPQEIVELIFLDCLPENRTAVMSTTEAPMILCYICSAWRSIAISMPK
ncbi:hypothetical protein DFH06DRAFT_1416645 [Mycena polygramma]|nr:hypothetical protein DFH06DRAFT_1416645 [Mycena polygramma]